MKYKVVTDSYIYDFEEKVEGYLSDGYTLYGNISVIPISGNRAWYTQVLVKEGNEDNETMLTENEENEYCDTMSIEDSDF